MKKIIILSSLLLIIITMVSCTNNSTSTPQDAQISQPTEIKLTKENITSYLVIDSSESFFELRNPYSGYGYTSVDAIGNVKLNIFPKKHGYFENLKIGIECRQKNWEEAYDEETVEIFYIDVPVDGKLTKTFTIPELNLQIKSMKPTISPEVSVKVRFVTGTFVEQ